MTRILIADSSDVVRLGVRHIVEARPDWEVVAEAADGREAILQAIACKPDVAVIEHFLPAFDGVDVANRIRAQLPNTEILIFTTSENEIFVSRVLAAGARGLLFKSDASQCLVEAIDSLAAHRPFFTERVSNRLLQNFLKARCPSRMRSRVGNGQLPG